MRTPPESATRHQRYLDAIAYEQQLPHPTTTILTPSILTNPSLPPIGHHPLIEIIDGFPLQHVQYILAPTDKGQSSLVSTLPTNTPAAARLRGFKVWQRANYESLPTNAATTELDDSSRCRNDDNWLRTNDPLTPKRGNSPTQTPVGRRRSAALTALLAQTCSYYADLSARLTSHGRRKRTPLHSTWDANAAAPRTERFDGPHCRAVVVTRVARKLLSIHGSRRPSRSASRQRPSLHAVDAVVSEARPHSGTKTNQDSRCA